MGSTKLYGYNGRILRVNLSEGKIIAEEPPDDYYQRYLGGRGFIVTTLLKEVLAERGTTLARIFNLREGFSEADDRLPKRMSAPQRKGNFTNIAVDPAKLREMQHQYCQMLGWDERGVPTKARLAELDIEWAG